MDDEKLPLTDHLTELRSRVIRILIAWALGIAVAWNFSELIFGYLLRPAIAAGSGLGLWLYGRLGERHFHRIVLGLLLALGLTLLI